MIPACPARIYNLPNEPTRRGARLPFNIASRNIGVATLPDTPYRGRFFHGIINLHGVTIYQYNFVPSMIGISAYIAGEL